MGVPRLSADDPGSHSNPGEILVTHMDIHFDVNFPKKTLSGSVVLTTQIKSKTCEELLLDTRDLDVKKVFSETDKSELLFSVDKPILTFGSKLSIQLPKVTSENEDLKTWTAGNTIKLKGVKRIKLKNSRKLLARLLIKIEYETSPEATALQWLSPEQTVGETHPYVFSQCQPHHCRSIIPCQDSSGVKGTYNATVTVPEEFIALMSAVKDKEPVFEKNGKKTFSFSQSVPMPAYLIALAVGNLECRKIGPRSHVWAEPEIVEKAEYEFADTDLFLKTAEEICGPYVWKIYDILVLPPSFPFGGMENPCLTFITPTLLVGDRSLVEVIAHEISHSWTGNLVSVKNFEHFWLNEGFTTFIERKIIGRTNGEAHRQFSAIGGLKSLRQCVKTLGETNPLTKLVVDLTGVDPDDAFSVCYYEKGHTFLFYLEELLGGAEKFESFLRSYFDKFKYQSLTTDDFKDYLILHFKDNENVKSIDWNLWLDSPGMPPIIPKYDTSLQEACVTLVQRWCDWKEEEEPCPFSKDDISDLCPGQIEEFCALLLEKTPISIDKLKKLNEKYNMNDIKNSEIRYRWILICIQSHWEEQTDFALEFATSQGRMKYCRPIFRDLFAWEKTRDKAFEVLKQCESKFMHVLVRNFHNDYANIMKSSNYPNEP